MDIEALRNHLNNLKLNGHSAPMKLISDVLSEVCLGTKNFWIEDQKNDKFSLEVDDKITFSIPDNIPDDFCSPKHLSIKSKNLDINAKSHLTFHGGGRVRFLIESLSIKMKNPHSKLLETKKYSGILHMGERPPLLNTTYIDTTSTNETLFIQKGQSVSIGASTLHAIDYKIKNDPNEKLIPKIFLFWADSGVTDNDLKFYTKCIYELSGILEGAWVNPYLLSISASETSLDIDMVPLRPQPKGLRPPFPTTYSEQYDLDEGTDLIHWRVGQMICAYKTKKSLEESTIVVILELFPLLLTNPWGTKGFIANAIIEALTSRLTDDQEMGVTKASINASKILSEYIKDNPSELEAKTILEISTRMQKPKQPSRRSRIKELLNNKLHLKLSRAEKQIINGTRNLYAHEVIDDRIHAEESEDKAFGKEEILVSIATKAVLSYLDYDGKFYKQNYANDNIVETIRER